MEYISPTSCQTFQYWLHLKFLLVPLVKNSKFEDFPFKNLENNYKSFYDIITNVVITPLTKDVIMYICYIFIYVIIHRCYILLIKLYIEWAGFMHLIRTTNCICSPVWIRCVKRGILPTTYSICIVLWKSMILQDIS